MQDTVLNHFGEDAIEAQLDTGKGRGPLNHTHEKKS
jgi:hypothetical protein